MTALKSNLADKEYPIGIFTSVYTGNELFLADHIIQGKKILPGVAYLEIARAAVAKSVILTNEQMIVLKNSIFIQAILVSDECSIEVKVYPGAHGEFGVEVSSDQGIHFQTKVFIQNKQEQIAETETVVLDIQSLEQQCTTAGPTKQQFYDNMKKRLVVLGPSHRGIESVRIGNDCLFVRVSLPGSSQRNMDMDPGMLDSFIQSAMVLASNPESNVVPFAVKSTKIFGPLTDHMYAHVIKNDQSIDYIIADEKGEVRVIINGFVSREIDLGSKDDRLVFYNPEWQEETDITDGQEDIKDITIIREHADYKSLVKSIIGTAQKLIQDKVEQHIIEVQLPEDKPSWKGIIALLKTITLEYPKISYKLKIGNRILKLTYKEVEESATSESVWQDNKTILITGGIGGIGRLIALDIAEHSKGCTLILVGRSTLTEEGKKFIEQLETLGAEVIYISCDITKQTEVIELIAKFPQINGIIHGAGNNKDNFINKKSIEEIEQVLAPKVEGLEYLDQATVDLKLDYFVTLSSIAGTLGNAGQADYAAANGYMDAYMQNRAQQVKNRQRYGKSISINWPLWESGGMQLDEETKRNLLRVFKIKPMPSLFGLTALKQLIVAGQQQSVVLFGNKTAIETLFDKITNSTQNVQKKTFRVEVDKLTQGIVQEIRMQVAEHLKLQSGQLDETADWTEFGFDSILLASFINRINTQYDMNLLPTVLFENTNINQFSRYLAENYPDQMSKKLSLDGEEQPEIISQKTTVTIPEPDNLAISSFAQSFRRNYKANIAYRDKDMAIVGMSCKIAGAHNVDEFWKILDEGKDMITEIPKDRWDWREYPDVRKWGSFIDNVAEFDPLFFGVSPAEAIYMSPEQRLMMQYVWECVENAGYNINDLKGTNTGLFIGCGPSGYSYFLRNMPIEAYSATGMVPSVGPNRISYMLDWHGPSNPIETACSSALIALHRAVEAIRLGHCDQAVIGGVNLLLSPDGYISFTKSGMLCEDGRCKTFSEKANGYVRGEGVGMLMVKPLKKAIQDGNVIHAVVKGTAENHGGRTNSLTAPSPKSQSEVIKKAINDADIEFSRVSYIECHGTGTPLGDLIEIEGLKMVASDLLKDKNNVQQCKLGSIKSNIGHLEYGAGVVGLIKVILQMKHKKIAKSLHCDNINPYINLVGTSFEIAQNASDWNVEPGQTRIAGVSSFGFGGVNAHVVLEEYQEMANSGQHEKDQNKTDQLQLLIISARSEDNLMEYVARFQRYIDTVDKSTETLRRIAYTLQTGRLEMQERLVFIAKSIDEWKEQIDIFLRGKGKINNRNIYRGTTKAGISNNWGISDTKAGRDFIKQLLETNEHEKIAELWVKGTKIDWQILYA